ncbi:MAG TPA: hypothetical protein VHB45_11250 [Alloacidobacterium sp.]|nr:hypothetical protein [Alloacidobacterium sp.]
MAKPIEMRPQPRDAREELQRRLNDAPMEHADSMLSLYKLLQQLHDSGTLDLLRGALGAENAIISHATSLITQPESVRNIRNLIILAKLLGSVDPEVLHHFSEIFSKITEQANDEDPPSTLTLFHRFRSKDSRRALAAGISVLEGVGRELNTKRG